MSRTKFLIDFLLSLLGSFHDVIANELNSSSEVSSNLNRTFTFTFSPLGKVLKPLTPPAMD